MRAESISLCASESRDPDFIQVEGKSRSSQVEFRTSSRCDIRFRWPTNAKFYIGTHDQ